MKHQIEDITKDCIRKGLLYIDSFNTHGFNIAVYRDNSNAKILPYKECIVFVNKNEYYIEKGSHMKVIIRKLDDPLYLEPFNRKVLLFALDHYPHLKNKSGFFNPSDYLKCLEIESIEKPKPKTVLEALDIYARVN